MLKPLVMKKAIVLPPPQSYLEEWQAHVQLRTSETLQSVLQQHGAAMRIQLRYKTYQNKVRALLKKTEKLPRDEQTRSDAANVPTNATKASARERSVAGSSMALAAVAYNVRSSNTDSNAPGAAGSSSQADATTTNSSSQTLVFKAAADAKSYTSDWRANRKDASDASSNKWRAPPDWRLAAPQATAAAAVQLLHDDEDDSAVPPAATTSIDTTSASVIGAGAPTATVVEPSASTTRTHGLVDIMHHSWLLASMEERCAAAAASVGASSLSSPLRVSDFRHTLLDLVFIARSGVGHTLHGHPPASVATHHARLLTRVERAFANNESSLTADDTRRVTRIFQSLQSDMLLPAVRLLGWLLTKTWRLLFDSVHVDAASLHRMLEAIAQLQATEDVSVVFAPTHKTHLDYLLISYVCFAYGVPLPRIAAGNNLDLPLIGRFLRANGSFFIRRSFRDDQLYRNVLESYVHELLADGNPVEVFVEGGRSRHGRVGKPKLGFLSMFHAFTQSSSGSTKKPRTVVLVPIALDYDRVYEVEEYANQLLGKPKEPESIRGFIQSLVDIAFLKCGHAYVRFGTPLALTATAPLDATADELAVRMQTAGTITSTSIVAALLMWKRTCQTTAMLTTRVLWLVKELELREAHVAHVADEQITAHALTVLKVRASDSVLTPELEFPTRALELAFYRNHLLHVFLPELAVAGAIDALLRAHNAPPAATVVALSVAAVEETALMMWNFLQHICRHAPLDIAAYIPVFVTTHAATACTLQQRTGSSGSLEAAVITVDVAQWRTHKLTGFALSLLWPFVDSLWLCAHGLWSLFEEGEHTERAVVQRVQVLARELFLGGSLVHAEAFCSESIKQSLDFLVERGLIQYAPSTRDTRARAVVFCGSTDSSDSSGDIDSRCAFVQALVDEVHGWRKPTRAHLWTLHATAPQTLTRDDALALMARASRNSKDGVYDKWMTPAARS